MQDLLTALQELGAPLGGLIVALFAVVLPWTPLVAWLVFWMYAVNWTKLRVTLVRGGWIAVVLIGMMAVLVWGTIAPPEGGKFDLFGFQVTNFVEKTAYVCGLICLMLVAGSVQLSGGCGAWCQFDEPEPEDDGHGHDSHGHDAHGHDAHGHDAHGTDEGHGHSVPIHAPAH